MTSLIHVATYYTDPPDRKPVKSHVRAYTRDYNHVWAGYEGYDIEAETGGEAKSLAIQARLEREIERWEGLQQP